MLSTRRQNLSELIQCSYCTQSFRGGTCLVFSFLRTSQQRSSDNTQFHSFSGICSREKTIQYLKNVIQRQSRETVHFASLGGHLTDLIHIVSSSHTYRQDTIMFLQDSFSTCLIYNFHSEENPIKKAVHNLKALKLTVLLGKSLTLVFYWEIAHCKQSFL